MSQVLPTSPLPQEGVLHAPKRWHLWITWALCLPLLLLLAGSASASRTQEGRVLETAREMIEGISPWLLPQCSGELRLQKPPLAYWVAAGGFSVGGVNEWAGRIPFVLSTWLTIGLTAHIGATLFGRRAGLLAIAMMAACYGTYRFGRLAETDTLATLGVTLAVWSFWRASEATVRSHALLWHYAAATGMALATMGKGPPVLFAALFLIALSVVNRSGRGIWSFIVSGAPLLYVVLGLSWFAYIQMAGTLDTVQSELGVVLTGSNHPGPVYFYFYGLLVMTAPWSVLLVSGVIESFPLLRSDGRLRGLIIWLACCFVPLSLTGNKQLHYAMVMVPPCILLAAWAVDRAFTEGAPRRMKVWIPRILMITAGLCIPLAAVLPVARTVQQQPLHSWDFVLAGAGMVLSAVALVLMLRRRTLIAGILVYSMGAGVVLAALFGPWGRSLTGPEPGDVARDVMAVHGQGPYLHYDAVPDLPTVFAMRRVAEASRDPNEIDRWLSANPSGVLLLIGDQDSVEELPQWLVPQTRFGSGKTCIWTLSRRPGGSSPATIESSR